MSVFSQKYLLMKKKALAVSTCGGIPQSVVGLVLPLLPVAPKSST